MKGTAGATQLIQQANNFIKNRSGDTAIYPLSLCLTANAAHGSNDPDILPPNFIKTQ